jgi:hypothetical protein
MVWIAASITTLLLPGILVATIKAYSIRRSMLG